MMQDNKQHTISSSNSDGKDLKGGSDSKDIKDNNDDNKDLKGNSDNKDSKGNSDNKDIKDNINDNSRDTKNTDDLSSNNLTTFSSNNLTTFDFDTFKYMDSSYAIRIKLEKQISAINEEISTAKNEVKSIIDLKHKILDNNKLEYESDCKLIDSERSAGEKKLLDELNAYQLETKRLKDKLPSMRKLEVAKNELKDEENKIELKCLGIATREKLDNIKMNIKLVDKEYELYNKQLTRELKKYLASNRQSCQNHIVKGEYSNLIIKSVTTGRDYSLGGFARLMS